MPALADPSPHPGTLRLTLVLERRQVRRGGWSVPSWSVVGAFPDDDPPAPGPPVGEPVHEAQDCVHYRWRSVPLPLHRDAAERYLHNLLGTRPSLFVLCGRDETSGAVFPHLASADYEDAAPQMETDGLVFPVTMPDAVRERVAAFAVANYVPTEKRKRRRSGWADEPGHVPEPARAGGRHG